MIPELSVSDFAQFFREVHSHAPFPWQERLARQVADEGRWPAVLDLPTGFGKTAVLDIAAFHLALEADRGPERRAPVRVALIVDRRLVVDDAFERAASIADSLCNAHEGTVAWRVAQRLRLLAGKDNPPLLARRLRGGIPREADWARTPSQPTILCSTVDQVGSRLLFRGYGVSDSMKPVHAGLIGADCLLLLDEAHLSEAFRQTLNWVCGYRSDRWREEKFAAPWGVALLTATPRNQPEIRFRPAAADYTDPVLSRRWEASKPAKLVEISKADKKNRMKDSGGREPGKDGKDISRVSEIRRIGILIEESFALLKRLKESGTHPAVAVVVNRVARARATFELLRTKCSNEFGPDAIELILMIGPSRPIDRDQLADKLRPIRTGTERMLSKPLVIVSTQCIEAGVDIDLDGLVTDAASLDALRQRLGRLNRAGRAIASPASIVFDPKADKEDPVYGTAITETWRYLLEHSTREKEEMCAD